MDSVLLQLCQGGRRDIVGDEHGGRLEGDGWQGGEKGGVRRMRLGCCNAIWWRTGRGEAGGEGEVKERVQENPLTTLMSAGPLLREGKEEP